MKLSVLLLLALAPMGRSQELDSALATRDEGSGVLWFDARELGIEGQGWSQLKAPYDRLPAKAEGVVRDRVWDLSRHSAGLSVLFETDSTTIRARWTLTSPELAMSHMSATGVSGLDLYYSHRWVGVGRPSGQTTTAELVSGLAPGRRWYRLYLPLYNGVRSLELGIDEGSCLAKDPTPDQDKPQPIVFYGTSITQGASASRPGMVHTSILGRWFSRPVINLGFSGNGKMDLELARLMGEIDACIYVIDCLPNMNAEEVRERTGPFVRALREARPRTPILLVEDRSFANAFLRPAKKQHHAASRKALRAAFDALLESGIADLHYLEARDLLGSDGEATVDGSHPTDLGFMRQALLFRDALKPLFPVPKTTR